MPRAWRLSKSGIVNDSTLWRWGRERSKNSILSWIHCCRTSPWLIRCERMNLATSYIRGKLTDNVLSTRCSMRETSPENKVFRTLSEYRKSKWKSLKRPRLSHWFRRRTTIDSGTCRTRNRRLSRTSRPNKSSYTIRHRWALILRGSDERNSKNENDSCFWISRSSQWIRRSLTPWWAKICRKAASRRCWRPSHQAGSCNAITLNRLMKARYPL